MPKPVLPVPIEEDIEKMVAQGVIKTWLCKLDLICQGLRLGVPAFMRVLQPPRKPQRDWNAYIDDHPNASHPASGYKAALKSKLRAKYRTPDLPPIRRKATSGEASG